MAVEGKHVQHSRLDRNRFHRVIAGLVVPALLALGCGDDVKKATVTEENALALGLAATETAYRGGVTSLLLIQLGYYLPASVLIAVSPASAPSPGIVVPPDDPLCSTGTSNTEIVETETQFEITTTYVNCILEVFPCLVDGAVVASLTEGGFEFQADDVDVSCDGIGALSLTDESAVCDVEGCDVDLNAFDSAFEDATIKPKSVFVSGGIIEELENVGAEGVTNLSGEGQLEFDTYADLTFDCEGGLATTGVIGFWGSGSSWGALVFDDDTCSALEVCYSPDEETEPTCEEVPFPPLVALPM